MWSTCKAGPPDKANDAPKPSSPISPFTANQQGIALSEVLHITVLANDRPWMHGKRVDRGEAGI